MYSLCALYACAYCSCSRSHRCVFRFTVYGFAIHVKWAARARVCVYALIDGALSMYLWRSNQDEDALDFYNATSAKTHNVYRSDGHTILSYYFIPFNWLANGPISGKETSYSSDH